MLLARQYVVPRLLQQQVIRPLCTRRRKIRLGNAEVIAQQDYKEHGAFVRRGYASLSGAFSPTSSIRSDESPGTNQTAASTAAPTEFRPTRNDVEELFGDPAVEGSGVDANRKEEVYSLAGEAAATSADASVDGDTSVRRQKNTSPSRTRSRSNKRKPDDFVIDKKGKTSFVERRDSMLKAFQDVRSKRYKMKNLGRLPLRTLFASATTLDELISCLEITAEWNMLCKEEEQSQDADVVESWTLDTNETGSIRKTINDKGFPELCFYAFMHQAELGLQFTRTLREKIQNGLIRRLEDLLAASSEERQKVSITEGRALMETSVEPMKEWQGKSIKAIEGESEEADFQRVQVALIDGMLALAGTTSNSQFTTGEEGIFSSIFAIDAVITAYKLHRIEVKSDPFLEEQVQPRLNAMLQTFLRLTEPIPPPIILSKERGASFLRLYHAVLSYIETNGFIVDGDCQASQVRDRFNAIESQVHEKPRGSYNLNPKLK
ncbi:hypothetical protein CBS101457_002768 [Exobasidium rhododendri]|nr:hypothetical protein CBS101457_002768 [Exobasidium rhododendri]